ncbi:hypothetical protein QFC21_007062 [Naganishia friedmannii]|uniref:Uncharacterized protein n=1 Tax=Naganishia friedmannii TaxID=89922 RepID=A0ACC2UY36_9TREE|nr:hypothetical protein QFC21_007062 [Naganishia friedmannii]
MEENPSFGSPIRASFARSSEETDTDDAGQPGTPVVEVEDSSATPHAVVLGNNNGSLLPATLPTVSIKASSNDLHPGTRASAQPQLQQQPRSSQNIGRLGYRHSAISTGSGRTPQSQADVRRARRRSADRDPSQSSSSLEGTLSIEQERHGPQQQGEEPASRSVSSTSSASALTKSQPPLTAAARPLTLIEQHASLLAYIAQKETEVHEARRLFDRRSDELREAKKKWEEVVAMSSGGVGGSAGGGSPFPQSGTGNAQGNGNTRTTSATAGRVQPPMPIRRTGSSTSSLGGSCSSGSLRPNVHTSASASTGTTKYDSIHPQRGVMPLSIPLEEGTAAAGAANAVVEGSKRLFGHLLDSLAGINTAEGDDVPLVRGNRGEGEESGRNALVRLDDSPLRRNSSTEQKKDGTKDDQQARQRAAADSRNGTTNGSGKGTGTRQIKTLSLIAGKGSATKHRHHTTADAAKAGVHEASQRERKMGTGGMVWDMLDTSPPPRARLTQTTQINTSTERTRLRNTTTNDDGSIPFEDENHSERIRKTAGEGDVDFGNIWDGFAATPNGKDWKAMLAPTSHTLDFFSQALPTPNFNTLAGPPSTPPVTAVRESETHDSARVLGGLRSDVDVSRGGQDARHKKEPEEEEALSGGMDIPWNW